ncbi:MAG: 30S ribosomal protein S15 [Candidatus Heimdallarchaeota archaeon]|nr:30S ribosomal protein S15 [Candidatus Heimdallarchaeota archaeon]
MGRMHTRRKGKSSSKRPLRETPPEWNKRTPEWVTEKIIELSKAGMGASAIGLILRDEFGVASVRQITGKRVAQVLGENNVRPKLPEDLMNIIRRAVTLRKHLEDHHHDLHGKFGLTKMESKIFRLSKYYRREGVLESDWKYSPDRAALLVR